MAHVKHALVVFDPVPAERACGVMEEPQVNAVEMEGMLAHGQEPEDIGALVSG
jgi:hypothetical protein